MRPIRIFLEQALAEDCEIRLEPQASRHLLQVLRARPGDALVVFDGNGGEYPAKLVAAHKTRAVVHTGAFVPREVESALEICLVQGLPRSEAMDFVVQKAVELGATRIVPLMTSRSVLRLDEERAAKRVMHWRRVAAHACEQCGRNRLPEISPVCAGEEWSDFPDEDTCRLVLDPQGEQGITTVSPSKRYCIVTGPEGGLSQQEITLALGRGFIPVHAGPRILRTETAALAALAFLQARYGDW